MIVTFSMSALATQTHFCLNWLETLFLRKLSSMITEFISDRNTPGTKVRGSSKGKEMSPVLLTFPAPYIVLSPDFGPAPDLLHLSQSSFYS